MIDEANGCEKGIREKSQDTQKVEEFEWSNNSRNDLTKDGEEVKRINTSS